MEPTKQQKPADSKRSAGRGGTSNNILPAVKYHPSITQTSHQGRWPSSAQKTLPAQKPDKKPHQKPLKKPDHGTSNIILPVVKYHPSITQTSHQGRGPSPAQKPDKKPPQKPHQKALKKPDRGTSNIVLPVVKYHPSITQTSHQGRGPSPAQKPDKKPPQKPHQKALKKPDLGTSNIVLPVVKYHPSITQTSHQGRGPSPAQKTFPARKTDQKPDQKPDQRPEKKTDKRPDQKPDQRPDQRPDQKQDLVLGGSSDVLEQPFLNYGSGCKMGRNPAGGSNGQNSLKTLSSGPSPEKVVLEGGELTPSVVEAVEVLTRGQRHNPAWFEWRKHRITASNVHRIAHSRFVNGTSSTPPGSYVANITGQGSRVQTRAMRWGVDMEARAVKEYQVLKSKLLGREVVVQDSGLFIDPKRPWLAASPDGIVIDKLSGQRMLCLEVKCPFKHKDRKVEDACKEDKDFCLQIQELPNQKPVYRLKKNHSYYSQIQCQLAVTGMEQADLAVFTLKETALVPVPFDPEFWEETLTKLQRFKEVLLPQLDKHRPLDPEMRPEM